MPRTHNRRRGLGAILAFLSLIVASLSFGAAPALADADFDAQGSFDCDPGPPTVFAFHYNETNPDGFPVSSRTLTFNGGGSINLPGDSLTTVTKEQAMGGGTLSVDYTDNAGNDGNVTVNIPGVSDCTPHPIETVTVVNAHLVCTPTYNPDGSEFTLHYEVSNPDELEIVSVLVNGQDIPSGSVVDNGDYTIVVTYIEPVSWSERTASATATATGECTPDSAKTLTVTASVVCTPTYNPDGAEFTLNVNIDNPHGLTVLSQSHQDGDLVTNEATTVTVTYLDDRGNEQTATATAQPTEDCTPDAAQTMTISAHLVCNVVDGAEEYTLSVTENNPNGLTITDRSHADGDVVSNEAFQVVYTYTDNRGNTQTATAEVAAVDGCLPDDPGTMTINAALVCTYDADTKQETFTLSVTEVNPDGLTVTNRSHMDGDVVANEPFQVVYTYIDGDGNEQTATADVVAVPSCKVPDGDWGDFAPGASTQANALWGSILALIIAAVYMLLHGRRDDDELLPIRSES